ncbi:hypothetical protein GGI07_000942 [Coemansia sp. Benny D115]|nr:hypothetical protein GGI07_000942 [Coemansia sp. Benny D115]
MDIQLVPISSRVPTEILVEIFNILAPHQSALHACVLTCQRWNQIATPILWKRPCFRRISKVGAFAATLVATTGLQSSRYSRLIETLSFSSLPEGDRNNPHLATLLDTIVNCMAVLRDEPRVPENGSRWAPMLLKRSRSLSREGDSCGRPHSVTDLTVCSLGAEGESACESPSPPQQQQLNQQQQQQQLGRHESVILASTGQQGDVVSGSMVDDSVMQYSAPQPVYPQAPLFSVSLEVDSGSLIYRSSLRQLDLRFCKGMRNYSLQRLAPKLSSVRVLNLAGGLRSDITVAKLAQHMVGLERISLAWTSNLTDFGVTELAQRCTQLQALDLTYCTQIEDTSMFSIAHNLANSLNALSVAYCSGVTDMGVREVAGRCKKIRILNVAKCLRVTDRMRKSLQQQKIVAHCDSFEPFSIHGLF